MSTQKIPTPPSTTSNKAILTAIPITFNMKDGDGIWAFTLMQQAPDATNRRARKQWVDDLDDFNSWVYSMLFRRASATWKGFSVKPEGWWRERFLKIKNDEQKEKALRIALSKTFKSLDNKQRKGKGIADSALPKFWDDEFGSNSAYNSDLGL